MAYFFRKITNMKIGTRLFFGFLLVIMIVIAVSAFSIKSLLSIQDHSKKNAIVNNISKHLEAARRYRLNYLVAGDETGLSKNNEEINTMLNLAAEAKKMAWNPDTRAQLNQLTLDLQNYKTYRDIFVTTNKNVNMLVNGISQTESQDILGALRAKWQSPSVDPETQLKFADITFALSNVRDSAHNLQIKGTINNFAAFQNSVKTAESIKNGLLPQLSDNQRVWLEQAWQYFSQYSENGAKYYAAFSTETQDAAHLTTVANNLDDVSNVMVKTQIIENDDIIHQVIVTMYIVSLLAAITGLFIAGYITRQITLPIKENLALAEKIASGDLTAEIHTHRYDELGQLTRAMGNMNEKLRHMITDIRESIVNVASASSQIAEGNNDLSSRTEEQSAAVVETAASMEQLTSTVKRNAGNAHEASQLAVGASANATKGGDIVSDVVKTMDAISGSSKRISDIISVINGISFQTNILALNAAVEAARAGEQGRGFAVVAGEVRNLAKRSADAAKEIESLITESVTRVADGSRLVFRAGETMEEIVRSVANVSEIMNEIASASDEQSRGIAQIAIAVSELDTTTQQNASLVQESSAAASSLEEQAMSLTKMVSVFKLPTQKAH